MPKFRVILCGLVVGLAGLLVGSSPLASQAAQGDLSFTVLSVDALTAVSADCSSIGWVSYSKVSTPGSDDTDDDGVDYIGMVIFDGFGNPFMWDQGSATSPNAFANWVVFNQVAAPARRPFTLKIFDVTVIPSSLAEAMSGPQVEAFTFDPATVPGGGNCAGLRAVSGDSTPSGGGGSTTKNSAAIPGPDMVAMPEWSVMGTFVQTTPLYFGPSPEWKTNEAISIGKSLWVTGIHPNGEFYQVVLSGIFLWVPVDTIGPTYGDLWGGQPLPTETVE